MHSMDHNNNRCIKETFGSVRQVPVQAQITGKMKIYRNGTAQSDLRSGVQAFVHARSHWSPDYVSRTLLTPG